MASPLAFAKLVETKALSPRDGLPDWRKEYDFHARASSTPGNYVECRPFELLPGAHLCQFPDDETLNRALRRVSATLEGGRTFRAGEVPRQSDAGLASLLYEPRAYAFSGESLLTYSRLAAAACEAAGRDPDACAGPEEAELFDSFVRTRVKPGKQFTLIAFARESKRSYRSSLGYGLVVAQYFLVPAYRDVVDTFWNDLPEGERAALLAAMGIAPPAGQEALLKAEAQATLLLSEDGAPFGKEYGTRLRSRLESRLGAVGLRPLSLK